MLRTAIITSDNELATDLNRALQASKKLAAARLLTYELDERLTIGKLRTVAPAVVFIGIESPEIACAAATTVRAHFPGVAVVAVGRQDHAGFIGSVLEAGADEFLASPFEASCVRSMEERCLDKLQPRTEHLYSFLPAKAGVGASTLAVNVAVAMASQQGSTLLADLDLNCGMIRFLLNLDNPNSVADAAAQANGIDDSSWRQMVTPLGKLDVLHAGELDPDRRPESADVKELLDYSRRNYKAVCVDLSNSFERVSLDVMAESKKIFLVCTPELASLHLAKEKLAYLRRVGLGAKVQLLLNRYSHKASRTPEDIEELVGAAVAGTFSNDYARVSQATDEGIPIGPSTEIGRQCAALAQNLLETGPVPAALPKRTLLDRLSWENLSFATQSAASRA